MPVDRPTFPGAEATLPTEIVGRLDELTRTLDQEYRGVYGLRTPQAEALVNMSTLLNAGTAPDQMPMMLVSLLIDTQAKDDPEYAAAIAKIKGQIVPFAEQEDTRVMDALTERMDRLVRDLYPSVDRRRGKRRGYVSKPYLWS